MDSGNDTSIYTNDYRGLMLLYFYRMKINGYNGDIGNLYRSKILY